LNLAYVHALHIWSGPITGITNEDAYQALSYARRLAETEN
jgi:hypothetical protein